MSDYYEGGKQGSSTSAHYETGSPNNIQLLVVRSLLTASHIKDKY